MVLGKEWGGEALGLRGSAVRQDGRSASLTAPNGQAQQGLLLAALVDGALYTNALRLSELHGTGTPLGDPIEVRSMAEAVLIQQNAKNPTLMGGVKGNLGHTESAAGLTGLMNLCSGLVSRRVAPNAQLRALNPHIRSALRRVACMLLKGPTPLGVCGRSDDSSVGGVSSFGYSGTIAHTVLSNEQIGVRPSQPPINCDEPLAFSRQAFSWREEVHPLLCSHQPLSFGSTFRSSLPGALKVCFIDSKP